MISPDHSERRTPAWRQMLRGLDRGNSRFEHNLVRVVGSNRLNPLPHTGTISIFLLIVVTLTGLYLLLFYSFGFEASYDAVARMEAHPVQRTVRAVHRFASAGLVVTTLTHGWRTLIAGRFGGSRWWPWATGSFSLLLVWIAGVSGYWLIWDERSAMLTDALRQVIGSSGRGADFLVDFVVGPFAGSGWAMLLILMTVHVAATIIMGLAVWYHIRRHRTASGTRPFWPPTIWMLILGGVFLVLAVVMPVGMLAPADPAALPGEVPVDPFFLFLLPALRSWPPLVVVLVGGAIGAAATALPFAGRKTASVIVDENACTGCELCVHDCPYDALAMTTRDDKAVAVVDNAQCVACGICIGSCSFAALELEGTVAALTVPEIAGTEITIACRRHAEAGAGSLEATEVLDVECMGMLHPRIVSGLIDQGAEQVHVLGCAPGDCSFNIGNEILHERLSGARAPILPRRWQGIATEDWIQPAALAAAVSDPGRHPHTDAATAPRDARHVGAAIVLVAVTFGAVAALTQLPFGSGAEAAALLIAIDHVPGHRMTVSPEPTGEPGEAPRFYLEIDGAVLYDANLELTGADAAGTALFLDRVELDAGESDVDARIIEGDQETVLFAGTMTLQPGDLVSLAGVDAPISRTAEEGRSLFTESALGANVGCSICHSLTGEPKVGPPLGDIGIAAETRVSGLSAEQYLLQSILEPDAYVVDGYPPGQMVPDYGRRLTPSEIDALVQFMLSLRGDGS